MPRFFAARNRYRTHRGRAGLDRWFGHSGSAETIAAMSFPLSPIGTPSCGMLFGQPQWVQDSGRIAADLRRTKHQWRRPPVSGPHLTGQQEQEARVPAGLFLRFQVGARFMRNVRESRGYFLSQFSATADYECTEQPILRRTNGRTRGMKACR